MSMYYEHLLMPVSPDFRPSGNQVVSFMSKIVGNGNIADNSTITFFKIAKEIGRTRRSVNPFNGELIEMPLPTRSVESRTAISQVSEIADLAASVSEYDASISAEGIPKSPPCIVGFIEDAEWRPMNDSYHCEICCCVRNSVVRLYSLEHESDLHRPPDFANYRPRLDEDCSADERDGIFAHPNLGAIRIRNAGCGKFWIAFKYGKWIFPQFETGDVRVLDNTILELARNVFDVEFVEACNWG